MDINSLKNSIQNNTASLIDVRDAIELQTEGAISHALHIPMQEIPNHIEKLSNLAKPIIIFCKVGGRAQRVVDYLLQAGITEVYNGGGYQQIKNILK